MSTQQDYARAGRQMGSPLPLKEAQFAALERAGSLPPWENLFSKKPLTTSPLSCEFSW